MKRNHSSKRTVVRENGPGGKPVRVHVMLRSGQSREVLESGVSTLDKALKELKELGFEIVGASPAAVTVEGSSALFKQVFGATVKQRKPSPSKSAVSQVFPSTLASFSTPPKIPKVMLPYVENIAFPAQVKLHL